MVCCYRQSSASLVDYSDNCEHVHERKPPPPPIKRDCPRIHSGILHIILTHCINTTSGFNTTPVGVYTIVMLIISDYTKMISTHRGVGSILEVRGRGNPGASSSHKEGGGQYPSLPALILRGMPPAPPLFQHPCSASYDKGCGVYMCDHSLKGHIVTSQGSDILVQSRRSLGLLSARLGPCPRPPGGG